MSVLGGDVQTLELVLRTAEPTRAVLNPRRRHAALSKRANTLALTIAAKPTTAFVDGDDVTGLMVARVRLVAPRVATPHARRRLNVVFYTTGPHAALTPALPPLRANVALLMPAGTTLREGLARWSKKGQREAESECDLPGRHRKETRAWSVCSLGDATCVGSSQRT